MMVACIGPNSPSYSDSEMSTEKFEEDNHGQST